MKKDQILNLPTTRITPLPKHLFNPKLCNHTWEAFSWDKNNIYCECLNCGAYGVKKCLTIDDRVELNSLKKAHIIKDGVKEIDLSKITV